MVGMLWASNAAASLGFSSTLTLTTLSRPAYSRARSARIGLTKRHGPHHGAQRSTTTAGAAFASTSNVESVASTTHGRIVWHLPQNGAPRSLGPIRFFAPQFGHSRTEIGPGPERVAPGGGACSCTGGA